MLQDLFKPHNKSAMTCTNSSGSRDQSTNVLLSIKPEFAEKILSREKRYEFRKTRFRDPSKVDTVIMYSSSPDQEIVGTFTFERVIQDDPENLWDNFGDVSGIDNRSRFLDYFSNTETGYAIEIQEVFRLPSPVDPRRHFDDFRPPVSFQYVNGDYNHLLHPRTSAPGSD
jgi:type I restriction enzyme S subunit